MIRTRRISAALAGIALAALTFGSIPQAVAQPGDAGCSSMAMPAGPAGTADADAGNALTRAGQINAATNPSTGGAPMTCQPAASHG